MTKIHKICIVFFFTTIIFIEGLEAQFSDKAPILPQVVIQSNYSSLPDWPFVKHIFQPLSLARITDPYRPKFTIEKYPFPSWDDLNFEAEKDALNIFSFASREHKLNTAGVLFQQKKFSESRSLLLELLEEEDENSEIARLLLSIIALEEKNYKAAIYYAKLIASSEKPDYDQFSRAFYIQMQASFEQGDFTRIISLANHWEQNYPRVPLPFILGYMRLIALSQVEDWDKAITEGQKLIRQNPYSLFLSVTHEMVGDAHFHREEYRNADKNYREVLSLYADPNQKSIIRYKLAWLAYFENNWSSANRFLLSVSSDDVSPREEYDYLLFLLRYKYGNRGKALEVYAQLPKKSTWKEYASAFLLQNEDLKKKHPDLHGRLKNYSFNTPNLRLLQLNEKGNHAFTNKQYTSALEAYQQAISLSSRSIDTEYLSINYAQAFLKLENFSAAEEWLKKPVQESEIEIWRKYHLLYLLARQKTGIKFIQEYEAFLSTAWPDKIKPEIDLLYGASLILENRFEEGANWLEKLWQRQKNVKALEYATEVSYLHGNFEKSLYFIKLYPSILTFPLLRYQIKSLLALEKNQEALSIIREFTANQEDQIRFLEIEVLQANERDQEIIAKGKIYYAASKDRQAQIAYLISIADAHFNRKEYKQSFQFYGRALEYKELNQAETSRLRYNQFISVRLENTGKEAYFRQGLETLKKPLTPEIRFYILGDLANSYRKNQNYQSADQLYIDYLKFFSYRANTILLNRVELMNEAQAYQQCFRLAQKEWEKEDEHEKIDRKILAGSCALQIQQSDWVVANFSESISQDKKDHRFNEQKILLAEAYRQKNDFLMLNKVLDSFSLGALSPALLNRWRFLKSSSQKEKGELSEALKTLGDINLYREQGNYTEVLQLQAQVYAGNSQYAQAIRALSRLLYHPKIQEGAKEMLRLEMVDYLIKSERQKDAKVLFQKIKKRSVWNSSVLKRYESFHKQLNP